MPFPAPLRALVRSPRFTLLAVTLIALGTGACSAVFSIFHSLLLTPRVGVVDEARLVDVGRTQEGSGFDNFSWVDYADYRDQNSTLAGLAAFDFSPDPSGLTVDNDAQSASLQWVSPNYFTVLGTRIAQGRNFTDDGKAHPEIIISHRYWQARFNGAPDTVGRDVLLNNVPATIVGIAEPAFNGHTLFRADYWGSFLFRPVMSPGSTMLQGRDLSFLMAVGRLRPGATIQQASHDLGATATRLAAAYPDTHRERGVALQPSSRFPGEFRKGATAFLGVLGLLTLLALFVASANIAGLMLARGALRQREFAVRTALGADRRRLLSDLLLENLALFVAGGLGGILVCLWLTDAFQSLLPVLPVAVSAVVSVQPVALAFTLLLSLGVGLMFSLGPAFSSSRFDLLSVLRRGEQPVGSSRLFSLRSAFLVVQLSLSLALLITAATLTRSLWQLGHADPGFDVRRVEFIRFDMANAGLNGATGPVFLDKLLAEARQFPGVEHAALSIAIPLSGSGSGFGRLTPPGAPKDRPGLRFDWNLVSPGYFAALRVPLLQGRDFIDRDKEGAPLVGIVNETLARAFWPGESAVGKTLLNEEGKPVEIIGVARNAKYRSAGEAPRGHFYAPAAQLYTPRINLFVKSSTDASAIPGLRELVRRLQPSLPVYQAQSLTAATATGLVPQRIAAYVALAAGVLTLILAMTGIYGVTLFWANSRVREFGVRTALGATHGNLVRLALSGTGRLAAVAMGLGLVAAAGLTRVLNSIFGGVSFAPGLMLAATATFAGFVLAAAYFPARRAAKVNPVEALRTE